MTTNIVDEKMIEKLDKLIEQRDICKSLNLPLTAPVYKVWRPSDKINPSPNLNDISSLNLLKEIIPITNNYDSLTVRQIFYVLVSNQIIKNNIYEYKRIVDKVKRARLAGIISYNKIIDDTRKAEKTLSWNSPMDLFNAAIKQFRSDWWRDQEYYVEAWLEKRSLKRIFYPITNSYDVHLCIGGGYQSSSSIYQAHERFQKHVDKKLIILYFGDLDPSGKDMPRDIKSRLSELGSDVEVRQVALTKEDVEKYNLPKNPTKSKDSRNEWYENKYDIAYAVELDALPPNILRDKIRDSILSYCDIEQLRKRRREDMLKQALLKKWVISMPQD